MKQLYCRGKCEKRKEVLIMKKLKTTGLLLSALFLAVLFFFVSAEAAGGVTINKTNFPDDAFREYVSNREIDSNQDGKLSSAEIRAVRRINVSEMGITDLKGIGIFTELKELLCGRNELTALDISENPKLELLNASDNQLTEIDVSGNPGLETLICSGNPLGALDLSGNPELYHLDCADCSLTDLDISRNTKLEILHCEGNQIPILDIHAAPALVQAYSDPDRRKTVYEDRIQYIYESDWNEGVAYMLFVSKTTVIVDAKPVIRTQPKAVTVNEGKTASFTVAAKGNGLRYQWYYRTSSDGSQKAVISSGGKKATYSLTAAARHNGYQYRCKVTNAAGYAYTKWVTLTVNVKPVITTQPKAAAVKAGAKAVFKVVADGAKTYQWYYMKPDSTTWTKVSVNGTSASYSLTTAARHDGYKYRCRVTNAAGSVYSSAVKLTVVTEKPVIKTQPKSAAVTAGTSVTFKVTASGKALSYQWFYKKPGDSTWTKVSVRGTSAVYTLTAAARHNGYQYRCRVTNPAGSVYTSAVKLTVK